jgi:hypothetical protein
VNTTEELRQRWPWGQALLDQIAREGDTLFLAFSCGKDSLAAWLVLRERFRVVPVYKYLVPGLSFVAESIAYYEDFFQTRIIQMPHPSLYRWLNRATFQAPQNLALILAAHPESFSHEDVMRCVAHDQGLPESTWAAVGTRAADSPHRRMAFAKHGPIRHASRTFFPVWDMNKAELLDLLRSARVKLPAEYRVFGRSFDGLDFRFLHGIRRYWPADYARILEFFPLACLELLRHEYATAREPAPTIPC